MATNLRQAKNAIRIEGILATKELEESSDANGRVVKGSLSIKVDDTNTIKVKVYVGEKKKDGGENPAFKGIMTVLNEYKSIAEVGEEAADKIRTTAQFNTYQNSNGANAVSYQASFFSRSDNFNPQRTFSAECYIMSTSREVDSEGNETGRVNVKAISPNFAGIDILEMVAPKSNELDPNFGESVYDTLEVGATYKIEGEVVNSRVEKKAVAAFGKVRGDVDYKNELVITGGTPAYEEDRAYDSEAIRLAIQEYEDTQKRKAAERQSKAPSTSAAKPSGAASGRTMPW